MSTLAHASHWLAQVAYVAPVLVLVVALGITSLRDRRRRRREQVPRTEDGRPASEDSQAQTPSA